MKTIGLEHATLAACVHDARHERVVLTRKGKPVAFEDAIKPIKTDDWFDRRGFGWIPSAMHRDGEIEPAGFRESVNARHHSGVKRLWALTSTNEKGAAQ